MNDQLDPELVDEIPVFTGEPKEPQTLAIQPSVAAPSALITADQARAIAEVQAALVIARANPRDETRAYMKIMKACSRYSFAKDAKYAYRRGGKLIQDGNIRLAEVMAQSWENMEYGFREIARIGGSSEVEAYAWDLETNVRAKRQFHVKHWRDKTEGGKELTQERDKYEIVANQSQRRVRACIFEIIPRDLKDAAEAKIDETLAKGEGGKPIEDRVREMVAAFAELGVTKDMIVAYIGHDLKAIVATQLVQLRNIYASIRDGVANREEFFKVGSMAASEGGDKAGGGTSAPPKQTSSGPGTSAAQDPAINNKKDRPTWMDLKKPGFETVYRTMTQESFERLTGGWQTLWQDKCSKLGFPWPKEPVTEPMTEPTEPGEPLPDLAAMEDYLEKECAAAYANKGTPAFLVKARKVWWLQFRSPTDPEGFARELPTLTIGDLEIWWDKRTDEEKQQIVDALDDVQL